MAGNSLAATRGTFLWQALVIDGHCSECDQFLEQSLSYRLAETCAARDFTYVGSINAKTICQTAVKAQMQPMGFYQPIRFVGRHNKSLGLGRFSHAGEIHFSRNASECFTVRFDRSCIHVINYDRAQAQIKVNLDRLHSESAVCFRLQKSGHVVRRIVEDDIEKRTVNFEPSVVMNETQLSESVHEETYP